MLEIRVSYVGSGPDVTREPDASLAVCRAILEAHGGDLQAGNGRGTVFRVMLPLGDTAMDVHGW